MDVVPPMAIADVPRADVVSPNARADVPRADVVSPNARADVPRADVAKLADAPDLGSGAVRHVGSTPIIRTPHLNPSPQGEGLFKT